MGGQIGQIEEKPKQPLLKREKNRRARGRHRFRREGGVSKTVSLMGKGARKGKEEGES